MTDATTATQEGGRNLAKWIVFILELVIAASALTATFFAGPKFGPVHIAFLVVTAVFIALAMFSVPSVSSERSAIWEFLRGSAVQGVLLAVWLGFLGLLALNLAGSWYQLRFLPPVAWLVISLCALPKILSFGAAMIIWRRSEQSEPKLKLKLTPDSKQPSHAETIWEYEGHRRRMAMRRATQHAGFVGAFASTTLIICTLLLQKKFEHVETEITPVMAIAIAVATATIVAYLMGLARILVRAAADDASTRMFAYAGREIVIANIASVLGAAFVDGKGATLIIVGVGCALLGTTALRVLTDRAGNVIGIANRRRLATDDGFAALDGISEEDVVRLAEEGVDSVHALAFSPTARLFFNTRYSLQRICDWQDQALLIAYLGTTRAAKLRDAYSIRGVLDTQVLAMALAAARGAMVDNDPLPEVTSADKLAFDTEAKRRALATALGCVDEDHAMLTLSTLLSDELVERLRIYWRAASDFTQLSEGT